jgi:hypothetical protein
MYGFLFYKYKRPVTITTLKIRGRIWMTDEPTFVWSLCSFAERAYGRVLVAGLGLGIVVHELVLNEHVSDIVVIEREWDVINLVRPQIPVDPRINILHEDFYRFVAGDAAPGRPRPDTVIWDLAVGGRGCMREGKEIASVKDILRAEYRGRGMQIFVHGLDRDPIGEEFVKTKEFRIASVSLRQGV